MMGCMDAQQLVLNVYRVPFAVGQVYFWVRQDGLTLIDTGLPGAADAIGAALNGVGRDVSEVTEVVVTHGHCDHRGGAAGVVRASGAQVIAEASEVDVLRGAAPEPTPRLTDRDRDLFARVMAQVPHTEVEPVDVDRSVTERALGVAGGRLLLAPGHTPGSIALLLPGEGVLFTGDTVATRDGAPMLGVFNTDPQATVAAVRTLALLDFEVLCPGHGDPILSGAAAALRALAATL